MAAGSWSLTAKGMRANVHAARQAVRRERPGSAHGRAVPIESRRALGPASQRHLQVHRRRRLVDRAHRHHARRLLDSPSRSHPNDPGHRVVRARHERREALPGRRHASSSIARAMAARPSRRSRAGCRSSTPTISSFATRSTSTTQGRTLMFGSTTGSVWVSEDGGDSWNALSSNLPPVYAVSVRNSR